MVNVPQAESQAPRDRLFFALWPSEVVRAALAALAAEAGRQGGGKAVRPENLHLTLAFIGSVRRTERDFLIKLAGELPRQRFALSLDRIGYWRNSGIVWLGCREMPPPLQHLGEQLMLALARNGYGNQRRKFSPHLTLVRRAIRRPRIQFDPVQWPVSGFCLVKSELSSSGSTYTIAAHWGGDP